MTICFAVASGGVALLFEIQMERLEQAKELNIYLLFTAIAEELIKLVFLLFILKFKNMFEEFSAGIFYGILLGSTFGVLENLIYLQYVSFWPLMLRTITSIPLHAINGGILGYYTGRSFASWNRNISGFELIKGFSIAAFFHLCYNYYASANTWTLIFLPVTLIISYIFLDLLRAYSLSLINRQMLADLNLSLQEFELIRRHITFELWIDDEQKAGELKTDLFTPVPFYKSVIFLFFIFFSVSAVILYFSNKDFISYYMNQISPAEFVSIFIFYPLFVGISFFISGIFNPEFFVRSLFSVPLVCSISITKNNYTEESILFYLSYFGFYCPTVHPEQLVGDTKMNLLIGLREFKNLSGITTWINSNSENSSSPFSVSGVLIKFSKIYPLIIFYWNYRRLMQKLNNLFISTLKYSK